MGTTSTPVGAPTAGLARMAVILAVAVALLLGAVGNSYASSGVSEVAAAPSVGSNHSLTMAELASSRTSPAAVAMVPGVQCGQVLASAYRMTPWPMWAAVGAFVGGACAGYSYSQSTWWNNNFDRILNRCWPNCSGWDFTRMVLGIPG